MADPVPCNAEDLYQISNDTYCLTKQWLYAHTIPNDQRPGVFGNIVDLGNRQVWEGEEQIPQLVGLIIYYGPRYYPVDSYPHFTTHEISTAYALWQRIKDDLGLNRAYGDALTKAKANKYRDPR